MAGSAETSVVPVERVERAILSIRGHRVILDSDLAQLYGVSTKRLNEQIKRNQARFPEDFRFQLTQAEKEEVVANCDHLSKLKFSPSQPFAFTEHGAIMAAAVLNSERAVQVSLWVVRTFVRLRQILASNAELARKIDAMEKKYDTQFKVVFDSIKALIKPAADSPKERIGFVVRPKRPKST